MSDHARIPPDYSGKQTDNPWISPKYPSLSQVIHSLPVGIPWHIARTPKPKPAQHLEVEKMLAISLLTTFLTAILSEDGHNYLFFSYICKVLKYNNSGSTGFRGRGSTNTLSFFICISRKYFSLLPQNPYLPSFVKDKESPQSAQIV